MERRTARVGLERRVGRARGRALFSYTAVCSGPLPRLLYTDILKLRLIERIGKCLVPCVGDWLPLLITVKEIETRLTRILTHRETSRRPKSTTCNGVLAGTGRLVSVIDSSRADDERRPNCRWY